MQNDSLKQLEKRIEYSFKNNDLLVKALTHKSYASETGSNEFNERLEFLGDSILSAVVAAYLYCKYTDCNEGKLSQYKSLIVSRQNLSKWGKALKLGTDIFISRGEESTGGRLRESLLCNTLEALIGAIYLDGGFKPAETFILRHLSKQKRLVINDPKSKLQEYFQSVYKTLPEYKVISETGPDHSKIFEIGIYLKKQILGEGKGHSKKEAEQSAAKQALKHFKDIKNK